MELNSESKIKESILMDSSLNLSDNLQESEMDENKLVEFKNIGLVPVQISIDNLIKIPCNMSIGDTIVKGKDESSTLIEPVKKVILAIDNDECIGSWGDLSLLYNIYKAEFSLDPPVELFVKIMEETYCIRPHLRELYNKILFYKNVSKNIDKIYMFTAASNSTGWVTFLRKILVHWFGEEIYDGVIYQEMIRDWHLENNSIALNENGYIKNMDLIRKLINSSSQTNINFEIIAIDDKPQNIVNGIAIPVKPYKVAVNVNEVIKLFLSNHYEKIYAKYKHEVNLSWGHYSRNPNYYSIASCDYDIKLSIRKIDNLLSKI
jgi:hypothetical protein